MSKRSRRDSISDVDIDGDVGVEIVAVNHPNDTTPRKIVDVDGQDDVAPEVMRCTLPPHNKTPMIFSSLEDYEVHYAQCHVNRCSQCRKNFPTAHYLTLHIEENHDPLIDARRDKGEKTYRCFVEDCDKMYNFYIVNDGLDGRHSLLREERRSKGAPQTSHPPARAREGQYGRLRHRQDEATPSKSPEKVVVPEEKETAAAKTSPAASIDDLTASMSALRFIPNSVRVGRPKQK